MPLVRVDLGQEVVGAPVPGPVTPAAVEDVPERTPRDKLALWLERGRAKSGWWVSAIVEGGHMGGYGTRRPPVPASARRGSAGHSLNGM